MPVTITEEEYQRIRKGVMGRRSDKELVKRAEEVLAEPGTRRFETVEEFMVFLDTLVPPEDGLAESGNKAE